jgi:hypothetical protein
VRDLLLCTDKDGSTFLHVAAQCRPATIRMSVLYQVGLDTEIIKQIISVKDDDGMTVLHIAAVNEDEGVLLQLMKFIIENYRNPEGKFYI